MAQAVTAPAKAATAKAPTASAAAKAALRPADEADATPAADAAPAAKGGRRKLLLMAAPVLLGAVGAGLWFGGILPPLFGLGGKAGDKAATAAGGDAGKPGTPGVRAPVYVEMPEIIANLNAGPRNSSFIKLHPRLELARAEDTPAVQAVMPRLLDLFQTYLREMRPEEMRDSTGTYRLREELLARANVAAAPVRIVDVLFPEIIVQ
jgi:flagellar FliL protein